MANYDLEEIKSEIVSKLSHNDIYFNLKKKSNGSGSHATGCCPFHDDKHPSFSYNKETLTWTCFSGKDCGGGSVFDFISKTHGITFSEALTQLAKQTNVELSTKSLKKISKKQYYPRISDIEKWHNSLTTKHYEYLTGRGLTKTTIKKAKLGFDVNKLGGMYTIPIYDEYGEVPNVKFFKPKPPGKGKKKIIFSHCVYKKDSKGNYVKDADGDKKALYRGGVPHRLYGLRSMLQSETDKVIICEGELDCLLLRQNGFMAISGTGGCVNWVAGWMKHLKDKELVFIYDCDDIGQNAVEKIIKENFVGLDMKVKNIHLRLSGTKEDEPLGSKSDKDITDFFLYHGKVAADLEKLINDTPYRTLPQAPIDEKETGFNWKKKKITDKIAFCNHMVDKYGLVCEREKIYYYDNGIYNPGGEKRLKTELMVNYFKTATTSAIIEETIKIIKIYSEKEENILDTNIDLINLENGLLRWKRKTPELILHTRDFYSTIRLPIKYDPKATCPNIDTFFREVLPEDCIDLAYEIFGYCLIPDTRENKIFMLLGEGANGKSTFLKVLEAFIGSRNVSHVELQELARNKYKPAMLEGKLVNIDHDLPKKALKDTNIIKKITGGEEITVELKNINAYELKNTARLIFAMNSLPGTSDTSNGFYRRCVIIKFPHNFDKVKTDKSKKADKSILNRLITEEEKSGLLNKALPYLNKLTELDSEGFSEPDSVKKELFKYKIKNDTALEFVHDHCKVGDEYECSRLNLYRAYSSYCNANNYRPAGKKLFNERLTNEFHIKKWENMTDSVTGKRIRAWKGIDFNPDDYKYGYNNE